MRGATDIPGFLFPSQVASLMLVETEDLILLIAPIVWPIFGPVMALRYPTQPLRVATSTPPTLSILHFVNAEENQGIPSFHALVRTFVNFRPPLLSSSKKKIKCRYSITTQR